MKKLEYLCETQFTRTAYIMVGVTIFLLSLPAIFAKNIFLITLPLIGAILIISFAKTIFGKEVSNKKMIKHLLKQGNKHEGKIVGFKEKSLLQSLTGVQMPGAEGMDTNIWTLVIEYDNKTFETPLIVNNPNKIFANDKCTVYEKEGKEIAYDFNTTNTDYIELKKIEEVSEEKIDE